MRRDLLCCKKVTLMVNCGEMCGQTENKVADYHHAAVWQVVILRSINTQ